jgi:hypothetical protein
MNFLTRVAAGAVATTALIASAAVPAQAASDKITDKRADVLKFEDISDYTNSGTPLNRADSTASGIDITSYTVKHAKKSVKVTFKFADLHKTTTVYGEVQVKDKKNKTRHFAYTTGASMRQILVMNSSGSKILCKTTATRKHGARGSLTFTIDRSCLKTPKKLKSFGVSYDLTQAGEAEDGSIAGLVYADVVSDRRVKSPSWTKWLKSN